jgi:glyoxylase-like metal-dependent hydrolase (beta-lactamase superfamily II)
MPAASDLQPLADSLWVWQIYDSAAKCDLFSTAIRIGDRLFLVDPVALTAAALKELTALGAICSIIVTNTNHARAAKAFWQKYGAAVLASAVTASEISELEPIALSAGDRIGGAIEVLAIEGAARGEIALRFADDGGTAIVGDALINFEPHAFALLPAKYCCDQEQMRGSLRQLLVQPFERLLFAHGTPIMSDAQRRLEALLADGA